MPMSFPDMQSLVAAAKVHNFRKPKENEKEEDFRKELADHVQNIDLIESMEIRTGKGWDKFDDCDNFSLLARAFHKNVPNK